MNPPKVDVAPTPFTLIMLPNVEEADVRRLPVTSTVTWGLVFPMPMNPRPEILIASVSCVPDLNVEKINEPVAFEKFWFRMPVMAAVVVGVLKMSDAWKDNLDAVEVAVDLFERKRASLVRPADVETISNFAFGEEVPMPTEPASLAKTVPPMNVEVALGNVNSYILYGGEILMSVL